MRGRIAIASLALLAMTACGVPVVEETAVTEVPVVAEAPVTTEAPATTEAPTTTQAPEPVDEFVLWWVDQTHIYGPLGDAGTAFLDAVDMGDFSLAAEIAYGVSDTYTTLYLEAPETGTTLSNIVNEMLLTCSGAWLLFGIGVELGDVESIELGTAELDRCTALTADGSAEMERLTAELTS